MECDEQVVIVMNAYLGDLGIFLAMLLVFVYMAWDDYASER